MKTTLAVFLSLAMVPAAAQAQNAGFRIGIGQPPVTFPPTQAPAVVTRGTFVGVPTIIVPVQIQQAVVPMIIPAFPTVIVPNQILVPGQTFVPAATYNPAPVVVMTASPFGLQPRVPFVTQPFATPVHHVRPVIGTPRTEVLRQLGQPSVTIITSTGETLYFSGGVTIIIQNGQVTGPR